MLLFTAAKTLKQSRCPLMDESIKRMCYIYTVYTVEYYIVLKRMTPWLPWWLRWLRIRLKCGRPGFDSWGWEDPLEMGMATHSSILAWRIPGLYSPRGRKETDTTERLSLHLPFATTWMDLESTVLNEISHGSSLVV